MRFSAHYRGVMFQKETHMNSRLIPITVGIASLSLATAILIYFQGFWFRMVAGVLIVFIAWPGFKTGIFSSQEEVDEMTGADTEKLPSSFELFVGALPLAKFSMYAITAYLCFYEYPFYIVPVMACFVLLTKAFDPVRFNLSKNRKIIKVYPYFYIQDFLTVSVVYSLVFLVKVVTQ